MPNVVLESAPAAAVRLRQILSDRRYHFEKRPNAVFLARGPGATVTLYGTGKILITGPDAEAVSRLLIPAGAARVTPEDAIYGGSPEPGERESSIRGHDLFVEGSRLGTDESGKGDYFGPLVVAGVAIPNEDAEAALVRARVRDSKTVADSAIGAMADRIEQSCPFEIVEFPPPEYNRAFAKAGTVTRMLLDAHGAVIRKLYARNHVGRIIVDEFPGAKSLPKSFGASVPATIIVRPRAEDDLAVAAASILARRRFLASLTVLSAEAGIDLPKGAGVRVKDAAKEVVRRYGKNKLEELAKTHFILR
ncbi:MAG: ribonuclease HIII [Thermoplasmatota archaeon]